MKNLLDIWNQLGIGRRIALVVAGLAVFAAVSFLARNAAQPEMSLLFGGLEGQAAGDVISALEQGGVNFEVRGNAVYVPTSERDQLRMNLAGQGLPMNGNRGYELLDQLSGFSTTSQMFDAAYWRAKEGELARTIVASPHIQTARVHISTPSRRPFEREQTQTAAVTVTANGGMSEEHVRALQFLVSAAVPRLQSSDVAVIDDSGRLLSGGDQENHAQSTEQRSQALRHRAERLLSARVGPGNAIVEVTIDATTSMEQINERRVDPESRIAISTETTESSGNSSDTRGGPVTVASNLPDGDANGENATANNETSESRTLTNYDISETERQLIKGPGEIRRLTVAVLVNDVETAQSDGTTVSTPREPEELQALRELVASAVGLDEARGDTLTLRSMRFEPSPNLGTEATSAVALQGLDIMDLIQVIAFALVAIVLGLFVIRPILANARTAVTLEEPELSGSSDLQQPVEMAIDSSALDSFMSSGLGAGDAIEQDASSRLRQMIADRQTETLQVLEDWISSGDQQKKAS
ncbi:flagellar M-ring protein FliF [Yoonia litorea]|uniref:Flagellar M-ring protein n=1 Tax=Yoonia litorea TaxID=1123755 RepID=A0A1I6MUE7_9RHOB|nr:flagellar M-ring protein FliF [Yoonia litorea]